MTIRQRVIFSLHTRLWKRCIKSQRNPSFQLTVRVLQAGMRALSWRAPVQFPRIFYTYIYVYMSRRAKLYGSCRLCGRRSLMTLPYIRHNKTICPFHLLILTFYVFDATNLYHTQSQSHDYKVFYLGNLIQALNDIQNLWQAKIA